MDRGSSIKWAVGALAILVLAGIAWFVFRPEPAGACELPYVVESGARQARFNAKLKEGVQVEEVALDLVNDPQVSNLLNDRQNQAQLGNWLYCTALERGEFEPATEEAVWHHSLYHFLATGPDPAQMEEWRQNNRRPGVTEARFSVSGLSESGNGFLIDRWQGNLADFRLSNEGDGQGQVVFRDLPRRDYMFLAAGRNLEDDVLPVRPQDTISFQLVPLWSDLRALREFEMTAGGKRYRIAVRPPKPEETARFQAAVLQRFSSEIDNSGGEAGEVYQAMLRSVRGTDPRAAAAAPFIAGDLLTAAGLGDAAAIAYREAGLAKAGGAEADPAVQLRLRRVDQLQAAAATDPVATPAGTAFERRVLAIPPQTLSGHLQRSADALERGDEGDGTEAMRQRLRAQAVTARR